MYARFLLDGADEDDFVLRMFLLHLMFLNFWDNFLQKKL